MNGGVWHLTNILLLFFLFADCYVQKIENGRRERDQRFSHPLTSPLAQVGGALLDGSELVFGSSAGVKLRCQSGGIEPRHLRVLRQENQIFLEPLEGPVYDAQTGKAVKREPWKADKMYRAGSVVLVLRDHPVGPIVRIIDPYTEAFREFTGLRYFPVDEKYRVRATIHADSAEQITILDTQGWERPAWLFGKLHFSVDEIPQQLDLILFGNGIDQDSEFLVMFRDETSGKETYPACRYLSLPFQAEGEIWLDFNQAFNPSCAYASSFACPLPPPGNQISVPIRAGERVYSGRHR